MRVAEITGAAGLSGSEAAAHFADLRYMVVSIDSKFTGWNRPRRCATTLASPTWCSGSD